MDWMKNSLAAVAGQAAGKGGSPSSEPAGKSVQKVEELQLLDDSEIEKLSKEDLIALALEAKKAKLGKDAEELAKKKAKEDELKAYEKEREEALAKLPPLKSAPSEVAKQIEGLQKNELRSWDNPCTDLKMGEMDPAVEEELVKAVMNNTSIKSCSLHDMNMDDDSLARFFTTETKLSAVRYMVLYKNKITDRGLAAWAASVKAGALPAVEVVGFTNNQITLDTSGGGKLPLVEVLESGAMPNLRQIYLMGNPLTLEGKAAIKAACARRKVIAYLPPDPEPEETGAPAA